MSEIYADLSLLDRANDRPEKVIILGPMLRDQFAMAALPLFIGKTAFSDDAKNAAVMAYKYADAMMEERKWLPEEQEE